ncbi:MAG TPA: hypothetical protein VF755_11080 [Catenuloplanes sp.]|jgi:hypothetical protein
MTAARWRLRTTIKLRGYGSISGLASKAVAGSVGRTVVSTKPGTSGSVRDARWPSGADDTGRVSVFLAIALTAVIIIIGLAYDGAGRFRTMQRADNLAAEAARAAGQAIVLPQAVMGGPKVIDPEEARLAAHAYLRSAGVTGRVEVIEPDRLRVVVDLSYRPAMLGIIGFQRIAVTGSATAVLVTG